MYEGNLQEMQDMQD
jgi:hypothetical protein